MRGNVRDNVSRQGLGMVLLPPAGGLHGVGNDGAILGLDPLESLGRMRGEGLDQLVAGGSVVPLEEAPSCGCITYSVNDNDSDTP